MMVDDRRESVQLGLLLSSLDDDLRVTDYRWLLRKVTEEETIHRHGAYFASITAGIHDQTYKAYGPTPLTALGLVVKQWNRRGDYDLGEQ